MNTHQLQGTNLSFLSSSSYFINSDTNNASVNLSWQKTVGDSINSFIQSTENKFSQWFWQNISDLPKSYFSKGLTEIDYFDQCLWQGIFNEKVELLKEQLMYQLAEQQSTNLQKNDTGIVNIEKLKEQIVAGLPQEKLSLKEQLIQLQGLVGKYTVSPRCYEDGLDNLKTSVSNNNHFITIIEQTRSSFRVQLKEQSELLTDCLQGEVLTIFKKSSKPPGTLSPLKKILSYYKPLMDYKLYSKYQHWLQECYNTQTLLPPPSINRYIYDKLQDDSVQKKYKAVYSNWQEAISNWGNFLWNNAGKLLTLGLATQVTVAQAVGLNTTKQEFISNGNLTDKFSFFPTLKHQTFSTINYTTLIPLVDNRTANSVSVNETVKTALNSVRYLNNTDITEQIFDQQYDIDISDVLRQFDIVEIALQKAITIFSKNNINLGQETVQIRKARSTDKKSPLGKRYQCTIPRDKLTGLKGAIDNVLASTSMASAQNDNCTLSPSNPNDCSELVKSIQCAVNQLRSELMQSVKNDASADEVTKYKNAYDNLSKEYINVIDDVKKSVSQEYQLQLDELKTELQKLQNEVNRLAEKLQYLDLQSIKDGTNLCASEIDSGRVEDAIRKFKELKDGRWLDNELVSNIIKKTYSYVRNDNRVKTIDHIINFVGGLPWVSHLTNGYRTLFDEMIKNELSYSPKVLILDTKVKQTIIMNLFNVPQVRQESEVALNDLENELETKVSGIITRWASNIRSNNYQQIIEFAKNDSNIFTSHLINLIDEAYANNLENVDVILNFSRDLPFIEQNIIVYQVLFTKMKSNNHLDSYQLIKLAYRIKEVMGMTNYPNISQDNKNILENLKNNLPRSVRNLIWLGWMCTLKNKRHNEYLYAAGAFYTDGKYRNVFSWRSDAHTGEQGYWDLEPYDANSFKIKSRYYNEYLLSSGGNSNNAGGHTPYDQYRRKIFTYEGGKVFDSSLWRITPVDNAKFFTIFNTHYKEYLYADGDWQHAYDLERRNIFTWIPGTPENIMWQESKWQIGC